MYELGSKRERKRERERERNRVFLLRKSIPYLHAP
jgi:hypothetical protein